MSLVVVEEEEGTLIRITSGIVFVVFSDTDMSDILAEDQTISFLGFHSLSRLSLVMPNVHWPGPKLLYSFSMQMASPASMQVESGRLDPPALTFLSMHVRSSLGRGANQR